MEEAIMLHCRGDFQETYENIFGLAVLTISYVDNCRHLGYHAAISAIIAHLWLFR